MNPFYTEECKEYSENFEEIDREHIAHEFLQELTNLCEENMDNEEFTRLAKKRGLSADTIEEFRLGKVSSEVEEKLRDKFAEENLVETGWYKYECKLCNEGYQPTFTDFKKFQSHLEEEHSCKKDEEVKSWIKTLLPQKGIILPYIEDGDVVYANIRKKGNLDEDESKYRRPHHSFQNSTKTFLDGIYPATGNEDSTLLVVEGEFDALAAYDEGYDAISTGGISMRIGTKNKLARLIQEYRKAIYVADNDVPGLLSVATVSKDIQLRQMKIEADISSKGDISDQLASNDEINIEGKKPQELILENFDILDENEDRLSGITNIPVQDAEEAYYLSLAGLKDSRAESWAKELPDAIEESRNRKPDKRTIKKESNDFLDSLNTKMESSYKSQSKEEHNSDITRKLNIGGEDIKINPVTSIYVNRHLETHSSTLRNDRGVIKNRSEFKVFEFSFGKGEQEKKFKLVINSEENLNLGDQVLPLQYADLSKEKYKDWMKEKYRQSDSERDFNDYVTERLEGNIFVKTEEISEKSKESLLSLDDKEIRDIVEEYLKDGFNYDEKLRCLTFPKLVRHDKTKVSPEDVMPFNPHSIYLTGSSIGKSFTAEKVGLKKDDVSAAGLLGYASADDVRQGTLDNKEKAFFADEMRHSNEHNVGNQLLTILQEGANKQSKGKRDIKTELDGSMTYRSNPKSRNDQKEA
jgi:hypothetical protein